MADGLDELVLSAGGSKPGDDVNPFDDPPGPFGDSMSARAPVVSDTRAPVLPVAQESAAAAPSTTDFGEQVFQVTVTDPEKHGEGVEAYMSYTVSTKTTLAQYKNKTLSVTRRYRDFLWLHENLWETNVGIIIPPIPEKLAIGRFNPEFIEQRRRELEHFLKRVVNHQLLTSSTVLQQFLESAELPISKSKKEDIVKAFKGLGKTLGDLTLPGGRAADDDAVFASRKAAADRLEGELKQLIDGIESIVRQRRDLSDAYAWFGSKAEVLGNCTTTPTLKSGLLVTGKTSERLHALYQLQANLEIVYFGDVAREYVRIIDAVKAAMAQRMKALKTWNDHVKAIERNEATVTKLHNQPGKEFQAAQAAQEVTNSKKSAEEAEKTFRDISAVLKGELERFDVERIQDFKQALVTFVQTQIDYQQQIRALWANLLTELTKV